MATYFAITLLEKEDNKFVLDLKNGLEEQSNSIDIFNLSMIPHEYKMGYLFIKSVVELEPPNSVNKLILNPPLTLEEIYIPYLYTTRLRNL